MRAIQKAGCAPFVFQFSLLPKKSVFTRIKIAGLRQYISGQPYLLMKSIYLIIVLLCITYASASAQHYLGTATSNFNTADALYLNPALLAGTPQKLNLQFVSFNFAADNNFATVSSGSLIRKYLRGEEVDGEEVFNIQGEKNFNLLAPYAEVRLLGATYRVNARHTVGFHSRVRAINQFHNFDRAVYQQVIDQTLLDDAGNFQTSAERFNWNTHVWGELGLSYGGTVWKSGAHTLKAGASLRYLGGIAYTNMRSDGLDMAYYAEADSTQITNTSLYFSSNLIKSEDQLADGFTRDYLNEYFNKSGGKGVGGDIGFVYEFKPQKGQLLKTHRFDRHLGTQAYLFRFSVALTDLGSINYKSSNKSAHFRGTGFIKTSDLDNVSAIYEDVRDYLATRGFDLDTGSEAQRVKLPTALRLHADYNIRNHWYVSLTYIGNLADRYNPGNAFYNALTLTPRFDGKRFGAALPITYSGMTGGMKLGLGLRAAGLRIGSDDLLALVSDNSRGVNFYFGISAAINRPSK